MDHQLRRVARGLSAAAIFAGALSLSLGCSLVVDGELTGKPLADGGGGGRAEGGAGGKADPKPETGGGGASPSCEGDCAREHAVTACLEGVCLVVHCHPGFADCDGDTTNGCEADLAKDNENCGFCSHACASEEEDDNSGPGMGKKLHCDKGTCR